MAYHEEHGLHIKIWATEIIFFHVIYNNIKIYNVKIYVGWRLKMWRLGNNFGNNSSNFYCGFVVIDRFYCNIYVIFMLFCLFY